VLLAGGVPVPIYPPFRSDRVEEFAKRQADILDNAGVRLLITFREANALARLLRPLVPNLLLVTTPHGLARPDKPFAGFDVATDDPALIQYTSGSTGEPKGVLLLHRNLLANIRALGQALQIRPDDMAVSWLPLYHDMGLIGAWLTSLYFGVSIAILSPLAFLSRPERWLWAIHVHRATLSPAPNFAYELCARRVSDAAIEGLDLSSWRATLNGAEPVSPGTIARFTERFGRYGFKPETMLPVYGLAESSVALAFPPLSRKPRIDHIARERFESYGHAEEVSPSRMSPLRFVSTGQPLPGHQVRIVDNEGQPVPERCQGRLEFRGPSSMVGYYDQPEATRAVMRDGWISSGDLAYWANEEIFITGRHKDIIIKAGRNLYPQEIEEIAGNVEGVRKGCVAAFAVSDLQLGTERIIVVAETREDQTSRQEDIQGRVSEKIISALGVSPDTILLVQPGVVPKTSSGKVRRSACREAYLRDELGGSRRAVAVQLVSLWLRGLGPRFRRGGRLTTQAVYGFYLSLVIFATALSLCPLLVLLPRGRGPVWLVRGWARLIRCLSGCPLTITRTSPVTESGPIIFVANHASYVDAVVLMATLPNGVRFVAKREVLSWPVVGTAVRKAGHPVVDREETIRAISDTAKIEEVLRSGVSVAFFPEGTFTSAAGLRPFKLGAFKLAAATGRPICPVAIRGTRRFLPDRKWLPQLTRFHLVIGSPLWPQETTWEEAVRLRDETRDEIARHCGEPLLELTDAGLPRR
jgi:1-acyl-sn-glycerol-3-phosphate acyltransferase